MRQQLFTKVARLASAAYQERFIVHASKDEYALPSELAADVSTLIETILGSPVLSPSYTPAETAQLEELAALADITVQWLEVTSLPNAEAVRQPEWMKLRDSARVVAGWLGDFAQWERGAPTSL